MKHGPSFNVANNKNKKVVKNNESKKKIPVEYKSIIPNINKIFKSALTYSVFPNNNSNVISSNNNVKACSLNSANFSNSSVSIKDRDQEKNKTTHELKTVKLDFKNTDIVQNVTKDKTEKTERTTEKTLVKGGKTYNKKYRKYHRGVIRYTNYFSKENL